MPDTEIKTEQNEQQETNDAQVAENQQQATAEQESALESQNDEQHPSVAKAIDDLASDQKSPSKKRKSRRRMRLRPGQKRKPRPKTEERKANFPIRRSRRKNRATKSFSSESKANEVERGCVSFWPTANKTASRCRPCSARSAPPAWIAKALPT